MLHLYACNVYTFSTPSRFPLYSILVDLTDSTVLLLPNSRRRHNNCLFAVIDQLTFVKRGEKFLEKGILAQKVECSGVAGGRGKRLGPNHLAISSNSGFFYGSTPFNTLSFGQIQTPPHQNWFDDSYIFV